MQIDWRSLLNEINIEWRDKGANTKRGNININCFLCGDDPSFHLALSENDEAYYCYRNPSGHSGRSFSYLLRQLGIPAIDAAALLRDHGSEAVSSSPVNPLPVIPRNKDWDKFLSAEDSPRCLAYLRERGFEEPEIVCRHYDLRYARYGKWAGRLLFPIKDEGEVISWSGRAMINVPLRYDMPENSGEGLIYLPRAPRTNMIIVEGPIDALKVAFATEDEDIAVIAILGKGLNASKLLRLDKVLSGKKAFLAFDRDVKFTEIELWRRMLAENGRSRYIDRLLIPHPFKDAGEMPVRELNQWLSNAHLDRYQNDLEPA